MLSGEGGVRTFNLNSTGHIKRFCTNCGLALPNIQMDGALLVVPAGSLDNDIPVRLDGHIFYANKANWDAELENVPIFDRLPEENNE